MKRSGLQVMMKLIGLVKPLSGYMLLAILMGFAGHLCATMITVFGGYALLEALNLHHLFSLPCLFIWMIGFALVRGFLRYGEQACNHFIAFKLLALLRDHVFGALRRLCPAKLDGKDRGNLISLITSDIELLEVFYAHTISPIVIALLFGLVMMLFLGWMHPLLGVILLISHVLVGVVLPLVTSHISKDNGIQLRSRLADMSSFMLESLRGLREIIQYGAGANRLSQIQNQSQNLSQYEKKMKDITGMNQAMTNSVILLCNISMLICASMLYWKGQITFASVLISVIALMSSFGPAAALSSLGATLQNTFAAGNRVLDILEEQPVVEENHDGEVIEFCDANVEHVSFGYEEELILNDFSLALTSGKIIGINGKSGSGKSTLLKLLMRFFDVDQGCISLNQIPIQHIQTSSLRDNESFMSQDTHLFHDSISSNIRIAKLNASQEEIEEACRKASIHDFIRSLPNGYDTKVAELGESLSGGERQRIGLARAFLHDSRLMLLDEPTSNLDSLNEAVILKALKQSQADKTIVLVSHRASTMRIADEVYYVENGRMS